MTNFRPSLGHASRLETRHPPWDDFLRLRVIRAVVAIAFLAGLLFCPRVFLPGRDFPESPAFEGLPPLPGQVLWIAYPLLLALVIWTAIARHPRWPILGLFLGAGALALWDQTRWQPWCYQYLFLCGLLAWSDGPAVSSSTRTRAALDAGRIVIAGLYIWSGLQKCNPVFASVMFGRMLEPLVASNWSPPEWMGWVAALIETGMGCGLLFRRSRPWSIGMIALMHGFILLSIGPWGHNWNSVVWPWNVAMPLLTGLYFWRTSTLTARDLLFGTPHRWVRHLACVIFLILPSFSMLGLWDEYLSAALYTGNTPSGELMVGARVYRRFPDSIRRNCKPLADGRFRIDINYWAVDAVNVPCYPAWRTYRQIARAMRARWTRDPDEIALVLKSRQGWLDESPMTVRE